MSLSVRNLTWLPHPKLHHAHIGWLVPSTGRQRKVAMIVDERNNLRRPVGGVIPAKPVTLEIYLPLLPGQDRVLKFVHESAAKTEAARQFALFILDSAEVTV